MHLNDMMQPFVCVYRVKKRVFRQHGQNSSMKPAAMFRMFMQDASLKLENADRAHTTYVLFDHMTK